MQSRTHSLYEAISNIILGYTLGVLSQMVIFPMYGIEVEVIQNIEIAGLFSLVSLVRSYFVRRVYNRWTEKLWRKIHGGKNG